MRRRAKVDGNHSAMVKRLREYGMSVADTSRLGDGFPDIVVGWRGVNGMFEIKDPSRKPSERRLTDDEDKFHTAWKGQIAKVETAEEVLAMMQCPTIRGMNDHAV